MSREQETLIFNTGHTLTTNLVQIALLALLLWRVW